MVACSMQGLHKREEEMIPRLTGLEGLVKQRIPVLEWLPKYTRTDAVGDLLAGITVGLTMMPQAIAYAGLAGLDAQYGLYSAWVGCLVYIVFGTTKQIAFGPTALVSLLTFTYTHHLNPDMAVFLCFISGCVEFLCGLLNLGFLVDFVSVPVVSGFTSAAAITIASSQLKGLFGLKYNAEAFLDTLIAFFTNISQIRLADFLLGFACIAVLLVLKKLKDWKLCGDEDKKDHKVAAGLVWFFSTGRNALVVLFCSILAFVLFQYDVSPFRLTGTIQSGLPTLGLPPFSTEIDGRHLGFLDMISELGSGILVVPLISIISNIAISKAFSNGGRVDATQEMIALGLCNILGSFARSMPVAGAFSRSAVNNASGVRTTFGGLYTSVIILLALGLLTPYFYFIPRTSLAAVIMCAVLFMVDIQILTPMWKSNRKDLVPAVATFLACLAVGVEKGLLVGILVDVLILLYFSARPEVSIDNGSPVYWVVKPQGALVFPAVDYVRDVVVAGVKQGKPQALVLDLSQVPHSDFTAAQGVSSMIEDVKRHNVSVVVLNAEKQMVKSLSGVDSNHNLRFADSQHQVAQILSEDSLQLEAGINLQNLNKDVH